MESILDQIAHCVEFGKINQASPFPPSLKGQPGADEWTVQALEQGIHPDEILQKGFIQAMERVGKKFSERKIFVPQMLMSAKAMSTAMLHLKPFFQSGASVRRYGGTIGFIIGGFKNKGNLEALAYIFYFFCQRSGVLLVFNDTGAPY